MIVSGDKISKVIFLSFFPILEECDLENRLHFRNGLKRKLELLGYLILTHDDYVSYELIPRLVSMSDVVVCFWDKWFCSSTWKMTEIEESLKVIKRTIDPIGNRGSRPSPVLVLKLDEHRKIEFLESYEGQLIWLENVTHDLIIEQVVNLIGLSGNDHLPYLNNNMILEEKTDE